MKRYKRKGIESVFTIQDKKCCNSDYKVSFLGGKCECGFCKITMKSENNDRLYILSKEEFQALEEVEEKISLVIDGLIDTKHYLRKSNSLDWTEQERKDLEKFLNVFGSWEKMAVLVHSYSDYWNELEEECKEDDILDFNEYLKEKGYDRL